MKKLIYIFILILSIGTVAYSHVDNNLLTEGCGSCHVGHGMDSEPMLEKSEEEFCYQCHGAGDKRSEMVSKGKLASSVNLTNIEAEFDKLYRHPVKEGFGYSPTEKLPSFSGAPSTHAECVDCHNPHQRINKSGKQVYEVSGYSLSGQYLEKSVYEYEICFKCHIDILNISNDSKNSFKEFSLSTVSQHPVTRPSIKSGKIVSLNKSLGASNTMKCSDCHRSDDPNGPKGPHGSNYRFLLSGNYEIDPFTDESPMAYEFCYSCHDRSSLLSNESFPYHRQHIIGNMLNNVKGTSCYTCHASHSSQRNDHLIDFNKEAVTIEKKTRKLMYIKTGIGNGECYLSCHGHEHSPAKY
ncbi:MAG: cytochrome c3 family protein [Bacteroidota bacterium]|nr:cytochrome c3 family protein [Bacteroidota bacterium]